MGSTQAAGSCSRFEVFLQRESLAIVHIFTCLHKFSPYRKARAILFGANRGPRPSVDGLVSVDGLAMAWSSLLKWKLLGN